MTRALTGRCQTFPGRPITSVRTPYVMVKHSTIVNTRDDDPVHGDALWPAQSLLLSPSLLRAIRTRCRLWSRLCGTCDSSQPPPEQILDQLPADYFRGEDRQTPRDLRLALPTFCPGRLLLVSSSGKLVVDSIQSDDFDGHEEVAGAHGARRRASRGPALLTAF